jgi:hypothetical protein
MTSKEHYSFTTGHTRFLAMNAFDVPDPGSFVVSAEQLLWTGDALARAAATGQAEARSYWSFCAWCHFHSLGELLHEGRMSISS